MFVIAIPFHRCNQNVGRLALQYSIYTETGDRKLAVRPGWLSWDRLTLANKWAHELWFNRKMHEVGRIPLSVEGMLAVWFNLVQYVVPTRKQQRFVSPKQLKTIGTIFEWNGTESWYENWMCMYCCSRKTFSLNISQRGKIAPVL